MTRSAPRRASGDLPGVVGPAVLLDAGSIGAGDARLPELVRDRLRASLES